MVGAGFAKLGNVFDSFFEVDRFAEGSIADCVVDDRHISIIVNVDFHALQPSCKILQVPLYFAVTGQLIATQVSVMRGIAEVISQGEVLVDLDLLSCVIHLLVL